MDAITPDTMRLFRKGDLTAFDAIFNQFYRQICYFTKRIIQDEYYYEDIAIETFTKLFRLHERFETGDNVKAFLYITARNACLTFLRQVSRQTEGAEQWKEENFSEDWEAVHQQTIIESNLVMRFREQVDALPEMQRKVLTLLYYHDQTTEEVALALNISESTVRGHKMTALRALRQNDFLEKLSNTFWTLLLIATELRNFF